MFRSLSNRLYALATGDSILLAFIFLVIMVWSVNVIYLGVDQATGGAGILDTETYLEDEQAYDHLGRMGSEGRAKYLRFELVDLIYPLAYGIFFSLLLSYLAERGFAPGTPYRCLNLLPFGITAMDWVQNAGIMSMLFVFPSQNPAGAGLYLIGTLGLYVFAILSVVAAIAALVGIFHGSRSRE